MENGIEKIKKEVDEKVLRDTEYTVLTNGKWQKFAYYGMKDNGRLILLNTRYGTLTPMSASYFLKLISGKYPCSKRPFKVEYPEDINGETTQQEKPVKRSEGPYLQKIDSEYLKREKEKKIKEKEKSDAETKKWAFRLKTLPLDVEEKLTKSVGIAPRELAEGLEKWIEGTYQGSVARLMGYLFNIQNLLKGTEWYVK